MAGNDGAGDLFMKFVESGSPKNGGAIPAESTADLSSADDTSNLLLAGFKSGRFFEVTSFTFGAGIFDQDAPQTGPGTTGNGQVASNQPTRGGGNHASGHVRTDQRQSVRPPQLSFQRWRNGDLTPYKCEMRPITFRRPIDAASAKLVQSCIDGVSFSGASLIKRKPAGSKAAGEIYLRLDFVGILITEVTWSNDDEVEEECQIICRSVTVSYRPQLPDGTLGAIVPGFWGMPGQTMVPY